MVGKYLKLILGLIVLSAQTAAAPPPEDTLSSPAASVTPSHLLNKADVDAWLDGLMPYALSRGAIAGAVVVVVKDGQVLTERGYGYADVEKRTPVDPEKTLFRPGSVSKLFTWTAVMQLVQEGKLDLDADVNTYLDFNIPAYEGKPITLRNIMTHTSGFEESVRELISDEKEAPAPLDAVMKRWVPHRIFAPGTTPAYSNYATGIAGYIVERVSGVPFEDYIEQHILKPIGMTHSTFRQPLPAALKPLMSNSYQTASGKAMPFEVVEPAPAGSLSASGADMGKFMIAHLANGGPLLSPETAKTMHTTFLDMIPPLNRMALGFYEQNQNGYRIIGHNGGTQRFFTYLWLLIDQNVGVYISINSVGKDGAPSAIHNALITGFMDRYFPGTPKDGAVDAKTAAAHARMMAGHYIASRRSDSSFMRTGAYASQIAVTVGADGGLLVPNFKTPGGEPRAWKEIAPFVWREVGGKQRLAAKVVNGKVQRFSVDAGSAAVVFEPAPWHANAGWLNPAMVFAAIVLLLTALSWPAGAIARRLYSAPLALSGRARMRYHLLRGFAVAVLLVCVGWLFIFSAMSQEGFTAINGKYDGLVIVLQAAGLIGFIGLLALALWNAWSAWTGGRWSSRLWSVILVGAAIVALWAAATLGLLSFGLNY
ncbi:serine hydrolase domain-containing protein [Sphingosinicella microcystinivorans]|uniref:CubicO group peptidase (Beta-lactamase class C family) n=1 Tax=Sphingosinicella microcystinivorans TaxID=335406 RepID=A0AAD1D489_SPHMI|nr:serine hydrolase domain-containing protein [Sphingosinicella microcystinivorans]RKS90619.1 CubicO group peptidase (beta-lactamase class C family) [Sphingosinicella microcystinivorans]BBE33533.1 FmtA-like protein [Sphingosinicella microcystinivorans]